MATELHVGGRLEAVAPRRVTDAADRARLLALVAVAVAVHAVVVARTAVTARDSLEFARIALQFKQPAAAIVPGDPPDAKLTWADVLRRAKHPPGFPAAVLVSSTLVRAAVPDKPLPDQMLLAAQLASAAAAVLLVFPTYWLGRLLFGKFVGFAAALLFQVLPVPARVTSDGLTEGLYLLALGTALLLGVRAVKKPGIGGFLVCGLATGLTYLVRPEGLLAGAAVGLVVVGLVVTRRWTLSDGAARGTALLVGFGLTAAPYIVLIGGLTNKPTGMEMVPPMNLRERVGVGVVAGPALFADWYVPAEHGESDPAKVGWVLAALAKEGGKAFHYAPVPLTLIGLVIAGRRLRAEPWVWVPILYAGLLVAVLALVGWKKDYISERHTLSVVYVGCLFAGLGIERSARWAGAERPLSWVILLALVASCLPALPKVLHRDRLGHVHAGRYLKTVLRPGDALIDPFEWAAFYAERNLSHIPPDPDGHTVAYAVLELSDSPHSRLPRLQDALKVAADGRAVKVFQWPDDSPRVVVYKLDTSNK
jgi:hypothetical protein